jgi:hypothetical protein
MKRGFEIDDPSFTLRGNAVLRWESHPGSTLFQGPSSNSFLLKVNYWLVI